MLRWPAYDPRFIPALCDRGYRQWSQHGINAFCRISSNWELDSFQNLCQSFELIRLDFYRYLQVSHFFLKEIRGPNPEKPSKITQIFIDVYKGESNKGIIGKLYKGITSMYKSQTIYVRQCWEREIRMEMPEGVWLHIWETQCTSANSLTWRDFC